MDGKEDRRREAKKKKLSHLEFGIPLLRVDRGELTFALFPNAIISIYIFLSLMAQCLILLRLRTRWSNPLPGPAVDVASESFLMGRVLGCCGRKKTRNEEKKTVVANDWQWRVSRSSYWFLSVGQLLRAALFTVRTLLFATKGAIDWHGRRDASGDRATTLLAETLARGHLCLKEVWFM